LILTLLKMKRLSVKTTDCSCDRLLKVAKKCGFIIKNGANHYRVLNQKGCPVTVIPRHNKLKRYTVKGILEGFNKFGADIDII